MAGSKSHALVVRKSKAKKSHKASKHSKKSHKGSKKSMKKSRKSKKRICDRGDKRGSKIVHSYTRKDGKRVLCYRRKKASRK